MKELAYADGAAFLFPSREIDERDTPRVMKHCAEWGMEVHSGITETPDTKGKTSKTELLFVAKPNNSYTKPSTQNDTNLSPIILEEGRFIPVVNKFCYLGPIINHNLRESEDVDNRTKRPLNPLEPYKEVSSHPNQHSSMKKRLFTQP